MTDHTGPTDTPRPASFEPTATERAMTLFRWLRGRSRIAERAGCEHWDRLAERVEIQVAYIDAAARQEAAHEAVSSHNEMMDRVYDDLGAILRALGLGDHARPISAHRVVTDEILPSIGRLRADGPVEGS